MRSSTFSSKPSAWFKTKVFSLFSLILFSFLLVGCGGADYDDDGKSGGGGGNNTTIRTPNSKDITAFTFGGGDTKNATIGANSIDIAIDYLSTNDGNFTYYAPSVTHNGASYSPINERIDFASLPANYTVTAEDNTTKSYDVTVRRAFVVSDATELKNAIGNVTKDIADNKPISYITIFVENDITLSATDNVTIPYSWEGKNIRLERYDSNPSNVTITNLSIQINGTVELIRVNVVPPTIPNCLSPYICNGYNFNWTIRNNLNGTYILSGDIDLSGFPDWEPIGNDSNPFTGKLYGNGHTISGLTFKHSNNNASYIGLFGHIRGAHIENLKVVANSTYEIRLTRSGDSYEGNQYFGVLAGYANVSTISRVAVSASPASTFKIHKSKGGANLHVGGVVGYANGATIERSSSSIMFDVINEGSGFYSTSVGGITGFNLNATVTNSYATGNISAKSQKNTYAGGITGLNFEGVISNSYASGAIFANGYTTSYAGGIAGKNDGEGAQGQIRNSAALNPSVVAYISALGSLSATRISSGGIFENNFAFSNMTLSPPDNSASNSNSNKGLDKTFDQLHEIGAYNDLTWDFSTTNGIWRWDNVTKRPVLR